MTGTHKPRRDKLFNRHPYCHWCGIKVVHPNVYMKKGALKSGSPDDMATLDHLDHRSSGNRGKTMHSQERRTVLSCYKCNHDRGIEEESRRKASHQNVRISFHE
jgi:hypothetical protein